MIITGLTCSGCGAALEPQGNPTKIKCPYCDTVNIIRNSGNGRSIFEEQNITGGTEFKLNKQRLHKCIVDVLGMPETPPLDIYKNSTVKSVNRRMIPAYWFTNISGMGTAQYEKGMDRQYSEIQGSGENMHSVEKHRTEWFPMSMSVNDTCSFLMAGNRKFEKVISVLYGMHNKPEIIDIARAEVNDGATMEDYDIQDSDIFNRLVKPAMDEHLKQKAVQSLGQNDVRNLSMTGTMVMNGDVKKILLAIYEIVIEYGGKDYIFYLSNDGNRYSVEALPVDQQRLAQVNALKKRINDIKAGNSNGLMTLGIILAITGIITLAIGVGIIALIGGGVCIYLGYNNGKQSEAELNSVQTQLNNLIAEKDAARRSFIYDKVALQGVLSDVSGDASAFE